MGISLRRARPAAVPVDLDYVALGHVHRPQPLPGVAAAGPLLRAARWPSTSARTTTPSASWSWTSAATPHGRARCRSRRRGRWCACAAAIDDLAALASAHPGAWFACEVLLDAPGHRPGPAGARGGAGRPARGAGVRRAHRGPAGGRRWRRGRGRRGTCPHVRRVDGRSRARPGPGRRRRRSRCAAGGSRGRGGGRVRPLELDLTAFRSYDRATVDLRPHELVVISGDTGAGKTSLLDAIAFALFGADAREGAARRPAHAGPVARRGAPDLRGAGRRLAGGPPLRAGRARAVARAGAARRRRRPRHRDDGRRGGGGGGALPGSWA